MTKPTMAYFGPWDRSGHYFFNEDGYEICSDERKRLPWSNFEIDGVLQPGCPDPNDRLERRTCPMIEGEALIHYKNGWTALAFWDCSVDHRPASSSTYIAEGTYTFEQMVELAKTRFAVRWNKMKFQIFLKQ